MRFTTGDGETLEGEVALPPRAAVGLVVCHPHPLYGGDMDSHVVRCVADVAVASGLASLRFNFRGVGGSTGKHGGGIPEERDVEAALVYLGTLLAPPAALALAGYSFGAAVAARVAARRDDLCGIALIAPPLAAAPWAFPAPRAPLLLVAGARDPYCPTDALTVVRTHAPEAVIRVIEDADHFFARSLPALAAMLAPWMTTLDAGETGRRGGTG
ncbi:MAG TPA: alpha/beta family hydrolase [Methylomirabilota bacterium]